MRHLIKALNRVKYLWARTSAKRYEVFLKKKGISIGSNIFWGKIKTIEIDYSRPLLVEIGDNVRLNTGLTLLTHDASTQVFRNLFHDFLSSSGRIKIGNNVYFGRHCTVLKGVEIGDNCIIGYGSIVTKSIPANSVAVGRPAKVISSIEDYYKKRKQVALEEAFEYARIIYKKTGRKPTIAEMYEEFPFYLDGNAPDPGLKLSVAYQTRGFYEEWKQSHKAPFASFDEFLKAAGIE